ncbi:hypothetical protein PC41400_08155 [Paenibacillus chitinolyticus]|uniref:Uncharacterized protein n=1 Tax=Paenibacillus chitinolyticus TaxID=79263 RepID=A0A410WTN9_9BACL|nr:hypothetical protein [Paenibacillus chitinolyticus]MCY9594151.1 hypothetical protein [Paenibacillus chitinolyticus]MCY9599120.1 hypothetical protein [Paenibacillus chitinolyticus]QAV17637.1 hypothetical protein PC41400_08155 [Paenibacillus chitinolyticus]
MRIEVSDKIVAVWLNESDLHSEELKQLALECRRDKKKLVKFVSGKNDIAETVEKLIMNNLNIGPNKSRYK